MAEKNLYEAYSYILFILMRIKNMIRQSVSSSNIQSIGYDLEISVLEIGFHSGGVYQYSNVPEIVYNALMSASSHGRYFHHNIKGVYPYRRVG